MLMSMKTLSDILSLMRRHDLYETDQSYYALIDAAKSEEIHPLLYDLQDEADIDCLFQGETARDLADVAPYIVKLEENNPLTNALFEKFWRKNYFCIVTSPLPIKDVRYHLRKFNMVYDETDTGVLFRYYDPCVMCGLLALVTAEQKEKFFGAHISFVIYQYKGILYCSTSEKLRCFNIDTLLSNREPSRGYV